MNEAYQTMYNIVLIVLGAAMLCCLLRVIIGPRIADRIIGVNMLGSLAMIVICILAYMLKEGYLTDVAIIYSMLSFLAVVLLTKIYIGVYRGHHRNKEKKGDVNNADA